MRTGLKMMRRPVSAHVPFRKRIGRAGSSATAQGTNRKTRGAGAASTRTPRQLERAAAVRNRNEREELLGQIRSEQARERRREEVRAQDSDGSRRGTCCRAGSPARVVNTAAPRLPPETPLIAKQCAANAGYRSWIAPSTAAVQYGGADPSAFRGDDEQRVIDLPVRGVEGLEPLLQGRLQLDARGWRVFGIGTTTWLSVQRDYRENPHDEKRQDRKPPGPRDEEQHGAGDYPDAGAEEQDRRRSDRLGKANGAPQNDREEHDSSGETGPEDPFRRRVQVLELLDSLLIVLVREPLPLLRAADQEEKKGGASGESQSHQPHQRRRRRSREGLRGEKKGERGREKARERRGRAASISPGRESRRAAVPRRSRTKESDGCRTRAERRMP